VEEGELHAVALSPEKLVRIHRKLVTARKRSEKDQKRSMIQCQNIEIERI
jgi:hypothetical protein